MKESECEKKVIWVDSDLNIKIFKERQKKKKKRDLFQKLKILKQ